MIDQKTLAATKKVRIYSRLFFIGKFSFIFLSGIKKTYPLCGTSFLRLYFYTIFINISVHTVKQPGVELAFDIFSDLSYSYY